MSHQRKPHGGPLSPVRPVPVWNYPQILLSHGDGGTLTNDLLHEILLPILPSDPAVESLRDGATFQVPAERLCLTTESYVIRPLFFPGGDIGSLAVYGTINDIAMCGGIPWYLSLALIIEEGLSMGVFHQVVQSISIAAVSCGVKVITGDTKVVERGKADGLFINTTGVGIVPEGVSISPRHIDTGDAVILSGPIGAHGAAVLGSREEIEVDVALKSDAAPLHEAVRSILQEHAQDVHCLADPTRGGLAGALVEISEAASVGIRLDEREIEIDDSARVVCEALGQNPLFVANAGRFLLFCDPDSVEGTLSILRTHSATERARVIGRADRSAEHHVVLRETTGRDRLLARSLGTQQPRMC